jgi:glycosyltransferase involved in cell wall biosynthesis
MRVLILTQFFDPEPALITGMPLATWLRRRGHSVEVVTGFPNYPGGRFYPGYEPALWKREWIDGVRVNRVALYPSHDQSAVRRAANYGSFALSASALGALLSRRADAAYVYHPPATIGLPALLWKHTRQIPFVYHVQDLWPDSVVESGMVGSGRVQRAVEQALLWWCARVYAGASRIAVLSPGFKRILIERGVSAGKIEVIPNWVEEALFKPMPRDDVLARNLGLAGRFNVVYSGNIGHFQGLESAVRAAARLQHLDRFQLVFIGAGQAEESLRSLARELRLDNVRFLGRQPYQQMGPLTALADVLLVSLQDLSFFAATIPAKTQVALACGRPVLVAVRGDAAELVREAGAGVACTPGHEIEMASAIERLYSMPRAELEAMGKRGRGYYVRELSVERGAARVERLLAAAASEGIHGSGARPDRHAPIVGR